MDTPEILISDATKLVQKYVPKFRVKKKSESLFMKILGKILFFNKDWNNYSTTIGFTSYVGDVELTESAWQTIFHEGMHAIQAKKMTRLLFFIAYLFPAILVVPVLIALCHYRILANAFWPVWILLPLLLIPQLSSFRYGFELGAYRVNMFVNFWMRGIDALNTKSTDWFVGQLSGSSYGYMSFKDKADNDVQTIRREVLSFGSLTKIRSDPYFNDVWRFLADRGLLF